jgi:glutaminyl-peptide cyclotransferase
MTMRKSQIIFKLIIISIFIAFVSWRLSIYHQTTHFDGQRAYNDILAQVAFGPRIPGSHAHAKTIVYIQDQLKDSGWNSKVQRISWKDYPVANIIGSRTEQTPQIILGAHFDSRILADRDLDSGRELPVPGANDGASGVAILLELSRCLPIDIIPTWLVFFDYEDNGGLDGRDWIMGSKAFVSEMYFQPRAVIIVDMVGDTDLNIFIERNSDTQLVTEIWEQAAMLGYEKQFVQSSKYGILDDHTPFLEAGIPAVDIIDFDYPFWHMTSDTPDKVSPKSLQIVGETLFAWMTAQK